MNKALIKMRSPFGLKLHLSSMEILQHHKILSSLSIFFLFHFSSFLSPSTSYTFPDQYFINCGSKSTLTVYGKNFTSDENLLSSSGDHSKGVEDPTSSPNKLYQSARIFNRSSSYELELEPRGTYLVRLHFFPFPSYLHPRFSVSASGLLLLSNFDFENQTFPLVEEFFLQASKGKFKIDFVPFNDKSFAFINAFEVVVAPADFIPDSALQVTRQGSDESYNGILNNAMHVVHRINVGGTNITPNNDTMLRYWIPDDAYLLSNVTARNSEVYAVRPNYQNGSATRFDAPDYVYQTAKEMNIDTDPNSLNNFNISWRFDVRKGVRHLVRLHFCDIVSSTPNGHFHFNLYIYGKYGVDMYPYGSSPFLAVPFYKDFVVYSDDSGSVNISVGPSTESDVKNAFLNGVEIMEIITDRVSGLGHKGLTRKDLLIIVSSSVGGVILVSVILIVLIARLKTKKWISVQAFDWPLGQINGGSWHSRTSVRTTTSTGPASVDLNLGLKVPLPEILFATKQFDPSLIIGEGGFGKVYKGNLRNGTKVAIKRSETGHGQGLHEFHTEIILLSKIHHHHLVSLIGYCDESNEMILVYEFMENGALREHLYNVVGTKSGHFSWEQRLEICIGAAKGLHYLHTGSRGTIIHRDIKSTNILLDENYVAKVADFGLSRSGPLDQTHVSTEVKGSFGYLDPEYFRCFQLTQKSDVYSFGVVLLEVLCARPVIDTRLSGEQVNLADWALSWHRVGEIGKIVDPFLVGKINPNSLRKFSETVEKCLQEFGADRPNMVDVLWDLEYCLRLQHSAIPKEAYEDSTNEVSWCVPLPVVDRIAIEEDEEVLMSKSYSDATRLDDDAEVFSQLKLDEAR